MSKRQTAQAGRQLRSRGDSVSVNKVTYDGKTLIDLTGDTVTADTLLAGATAHNAAGQAITGAAVIPTKVSQLENDSGYVSAAELAADLAEKLDKITAVNTVFNSDGSISETYQDGSTRKTVFNSDGSITETYKIGTKTKTKKTVFNANGSTM